MLAEIPIISPLFQALLNAMGWVMAEIYRFIPNYGVAIVILTLLIKFALLPLGIKQIKSMQHMQAIQPRVKELQKKYKGNKAKIQEETMKLYREAGVSPFGGCLPLLITFPFLIAMYAVIRMPILQPVPSDASGTAVTAYVVHNNHLPVDSRLFHDVISHENTGIGIMNLQCSPAQSGSTAVLVDSNRKPVVPDKPLKNGATEENGNPDTADPLPETLTSKSTLDCGHGPVSKIPYFVLLALMVATTFYQQRQMNKANPPGAQNTQQQAILRIMPLFFGFIGYGFPGGLGLYWTISNLFQIGQQTLLLRAGHIGPDAIDKRIAEQRAKASAAVDNPPKKGFLQRMMEQQETQRKMRDSNPPPRGSGSKGSSAKGGSGGSSGGRSGSKGGSGSQGGGSSPPQGPRRRPNTGSNRKGGGPKKRPGGGGTSGSGGGGDGKDG
jgi:YidC/Oxa1 family membrane protein insertase